MLEIIAKQDGINDIKLIVKKSLQIFKIILVTKIIIKLIIVIYKNKFDK